MDHRIGPHFLKASVGFGGSCFQKDILNLVYLCKFYGLEEVAEYWHGVVKINEFQKIRFSQKIVEYFNVFKKQKKIIILGWSYKSNTNDSRESAAIDVTKYLFKAGFQIDIFDPKVSSKKIEKDLNNCSGFFPKDLIKILNKTPTDFENYAATVVLTEWEIFKELNYSNTLVFDGRNIIQAKNLISIGK